MGAAASYQPPGPLSNRRQEEEEEGRGEDEEAVASTKSTSDDINILGSSCSSGKPSKTGQQKYKILHKSGH